MMKVLVACEFSGIVRDAFISQGHDAISCDLLPSESPGPHIQGDVLDVLAYRAPEFDLMIAHPPCTHLAVSGARWFKEKRAEQEEALNFVIKLLTAPIPKIALENPISIISTRVRKPNQIVQPWWFGDDASKATCLWTKGLPALIPTAVVPPRFVNGKPRWGNQCDSGQNRLGPSEDRWKERSRTYPGFALAMATQWGSL